MSPLQLVLVMLAAALGGAINSIAGGGTLLTYPAIVGLGISPLVANATSTVALWPSAIGSLWGYRRELVGAGWWVRHFAVPSLLGGWLGAWLLLHTSAARFEHIVPFLVLGATCMFMIQGPVMQRLRAAHPSLPEGEDPRPNLVLFHLYQFGVGVYGGYFGAGIGILMLAVLGFLGFSNIHRMNGLKLWGGACMNAVAALMFMSSDLVNWPVALSMAVGGLLGGYGGSRMAQRVGQLFVRRVIVVIGFGASVWLLVRKH